MPQNNFPWTSDEAPSWADIQDKPTTFPPQAATTTAIGGVKQMPHEANSTASDVATLVANFNTLLAALQTAGIMASS